MTSSLAHRASVAAVAAIFVAACSTDGPVADVAGPQGPVYSQGTVHTGIVEVCLDAGAAPGNYNVVLSNPDIQPVDSIGESPETLTPGECYDALTRLEPADPNDNNVYPTGRITATVSREDGMGGTFTYVCFEDESGLCVTGTAGATNEVRGSENTFHGSSIAFFFVLDEVNGEGCTYTQGYWKNKGRDAAAEFDFDGGTDNGLDILKTPPKRGNAYIILAHQYIAAALNVQNGASMPGDVQSAFDAATAYFANADMNDPLDGGNYTKDEITDLAEILDQYNNGVLGPGHCDD